MSPPLFDAPRVAHDLIFVPHTIASKVTMMSWGGGGLHPPNADGVLWPHSDPLDPGNESAASDEPVLEQLHRAEPSGREAALLPDAGVWELRVGVAILRCVRRAAAVPPRPPLRRRPRLAGRAASALSHSLALADLGARCGVGRATTGNRFVGAIGDLTSDRAPASQAEGRGFESLLPLQLPTPPISTTTLAQLSRARPRPSAF